MYVSQPELLAAIREAKRLDVLTPRLAKHLLAIAEGLSRHRWFNRFSYREDLVGAAMVKLTQGWRNFDEERSDNAFGYFTRACQNTFLAYIDGEREQAGITDALSIIQEQQPPPGFEERQTASTGWSKRAKRLDEQRTQDRLKRKPPEPDRGSLHWKPNRPEAYVCTGTLDEAYEQCNALNIIPATIILRTPAGQQRVAFDITRRIVPTRSK